jgi:predicted transcriptional regulator
LGRQGCDISNEQELLNSGKYFYKYKPLRPLEEIEQDIKALEEETRRLMEEVLEI